MEQLTNQTTLKRSLGVPLLAFYGLGVTVGAGIFALIGEIIGMAGDHAPLAFIVAGAIAAATARDAARLAQATGYVTLTVFALINLSLFRLARWRDWPGKRSQRWWGLLGAALVGGLLLYEAQRAAFGGG